MLFKKQEKELKDLLDAYKKQNKDLKSNYSKLRQMYDRAITENKKLKDLNSESMKDRFYAIIGITKNTFEPIAYIEGMEIPKISSLHFDYDFMEIPSFQIKF